MKLDFKNKHALVVGGTRGIGAQVAKDLSDLGADVLAIGAKHLDFLDDLSASPFLKELRQEKPFHICINSAGINRIDSLCKSSSQDWEDIL